MSYINSEISIIFLLLSLASSIVLLISLYYTNNLRIKTNKAASIWPIIFFAFLTLFIYQIAEVGEYADELAGEPDQGMHLISEQALGMTIQDFFEDLTYIMPVASATIFICLGIILKRTILLPI